jgi:hypothetical protein
MLLQGNYFYCFYKYKNYMYKLEVRFCSRNLDDIPALFWSQSIEIINWILKAVHVIFLVNSHIFEILAANNYDFLN